MYILFDPSLPGEVLDPVISANIIAAAKRGRITELGEQMMLVPDRIGTYRDKNKIRFKGFGRVRKSECIPLRSLACK